MTDIVATTAPPAAWSSQCEQEHLFFASDEWHGLLSQAFGASTSYLWDEAERGGVAVTLFPAGPFRVGYLGFPTGDVVGAGRLEHFVRRGIDLGRDKPVALRVPVSGFGPPADLQLPWVANPETAIDDLSDWSLDAASVNHRRDVRKASRSGVAVMDAADEAHAAAIYDIYRATLQRHGGGLRYNPAYFEGLVRCAAASGDARVMLAMDGGDVAGFLVVVRHGDTGFYLHGGMRLEFRHLRPSALLMHEAIEWSRLQGCSRFNMMSSPPGQESLVQYKEKWGAQTREHRTYTLRTSAAYPLFRMAEWLYRLVR